VVSITFGYKLKLIKKSDMNEYSIFEKSVTYIHKQVDAMGNWICGNVELTNDTVQQLSAYITDIRTYSDIYSKNKYSSPSSSLLMFANIDNLSKAASKMIDTIYDFAKVNNMKSRVDKGDYPSEDFDITEFNNDYDEIVDVVGNIITKLKRNIITYLKGIIIAINPDLIKIALGVDIIGEYKKQHRRYLKDKSLATEFVIRYKAVTSDDQNFLKKIYKEETKK
jgi:hypothetical protein